MNNEFKNLVDRALDICENHGINKIMNGQWEVKSTETDMKYEVVSHIDGELTYSCACKAFQFSDKTFPEKICKHCVAVVISEGGYIKKGMLEYIVGMSNAWSEAELYRKVNTRNVHNVYKYAI